MASLLSSQRNFYNNIIQIENKINIPLKLLYNNYILSLNMNPNNFNNKENRIIPFTYIFSYKQVKNMKNYKYHRHDFSLFIPNFKKIQNLTIDLHANNGSINEIISLGILSSKNNVSSIFSFEEDNS